MSSSQPSVVSLPINNYSAKLQGNCCVVWCNSVKTENYELKIAHPEGGSLWLA